MTSSPAARLRAETREIRPVEELLEWADVRHPTAWLRRGDGLIGYGEPVWAVESDPDDDASLQAAAHAWTRLAADAEVDDTVGLPGTGLIGFGAFPFDTGSERTGRLVVPSIVIGRRRGRTWMTRVRDIDRPDDPAPAIGRVPFGPYWSGTLGPGRMGPQAYERAVRTALEAIGAHRVGKVVLARDLIGSVPASADLRRLAHALATGYPDTWTYAVDGIIGASPETLVAVAGGVVTARVLAGTVPRGADADGDTTASAWLATSAKDLDEHDYAVRSVLTALRPHTRALAAAEQPSTLKLPNVWHLSTDVEGVLAHGGTALDLVAALHPTAAVAGTPTAAAVGLIRELEPFDRGRYAGPVGWVDHRGDGEWAIALRSAQFGERDAAADTIPVTAHAGAGIVAGSDPESELLETRVKFRPIVDALA